MLSRERGAIPKPMLDFGRPDYCRNCESEAQPEFVPKHCYGMAGVTVVAHAAMRHAAGHVPATDVRFPN